MSENEQSSNRIKHNITTEIETYPTFNQDDSMQLGMNRHDVTSKTLEKQLRTKSVENYKKQKGRSRMGDYLAPNIHNYTNKTAYDMSPTVLQSEGQTRMTYNYGSKEQYSSHQLDSSYDDYDHSNLQNANNRGYIENGKMMGNQSQLKKDPKLKHSGIMNDNMEMDDTFTYSMEPESIAASNMYKR